MSYVKDKDAHTRGVGAIAAADARDPRATRQKRLARALATERRDMRMAGLPSSLGAINLGTYQQTVGRSPNQLLSGGNPVSGGGSPVEGGNPGLPGGGWGGGFFGPRGGAPSSGGTLVQKLLGTTGAFKQLVSPPGMPRTSGGIPVPTQTTQPVQTSGGIPVPTDPGSGASAGGGGSSPTDTSDGSASATDDGSSTDTSSGASSLLDSIASQVPGGMTTLVIGGAAALYFLLRKKRG